MSKHGNRGLLSIGVLLIILVISILLYAPLGLIDWSLIPSLVLALYGCWTVALAGIRASNPRKYERSSFSTLALGLIFIAFGGAWFFSSVNWLYSLVILLLTLGILTIASALKR